MTDKIAAEGGAPVRADFLPYSRPALTAADVEAVVAVLKSSWLTTGPAVPALEGAFAAEAGAGHVVAVASCTAALHLAYLTLDLRPADEVLVPALTFAATAAAVVAAGGRPVLADVREDLNLDVAEVERRASPRTRAVACVHMAGLPCDMDALEDVCRERGWALIQDCAHAVGARWRGSPLGGRGWAACYSFHAVKQIAAGEGGVLATNHEGVATRARLLRSHCQTTSAGARHGAAADFRYDITGAGFNYRLSDIHAALALSQLRRLAADDARRQALAARYDAAFAGRDDLELIPTPPHAKHGRHLYIVKLNPAALRVGRDEVFRALRAENIGVNVHYIPLHYLSFYREVFGYRAGDFPRAESLYERLITLPLFAAMTDADADDVITAVDKVLRYYRR